MRKQINLLEAAKQEQISNRKLSDNKLIVVLAVITVFAVTASVIYQIKSNKIELQDEIDALTRYVEDSDNNSKSEAYKTIISDTSDINSIISSISDVKSKYGVKCPEYSEIYNAIIDCIAENDVIEKLGYNAENKSVTVFFRTYGEKECYEIINSLRNKKQFTDVYYDGYTYDAKNFCFSFSACLILDDGGVKE